MASLRKRPGSNVWQCQFYVPDPTNTTPGVHKGLRQVRKSTGETSKKKALVVALELERNAQGVIEKGSKKASRAKAIFSEAIEAIERGKFTALTARKHLASLLEIANQEELISYTIESWGAEWLRRKQRDSSKATMARYSGHLKAFLGWLGTDRSKKPLESVTALDVRKWRESLQDKKLTGKTVLSYMKDVGALYRSAIREGLVSFNPCTALEAIDTSDSTERKPFTVSEVASLMQAAPSPEWAGLILAAAFTGLRLGDAAKLSWNAIDLSAKQISLMPAKTQKKKVVVFIPIQPDLLAYLEAVPLESDEPTSPVFPSLSKVAIGSRAGLSQTFNRIMQAAGVDRGKPSRVMDDDSPKGSGRITFERGFHSLRHTFTSWLRTAGVSEEDRMALTGHRTRESHSIYSHPDTTALCEAIAKLPTLKGGA